MSSKGFEIDLKNVFSPAETLISPDSSRENTQPQSTLSQEARLAALRNRVAAARVPSKQFVSNPVANSNVEIAAISNESPRVNAARSSLSQAEKYLAHISAEANQRVNGPTPEQQQQIAAGKTLVEQWKNELMNATQEQGSQELDKSFEGIINQYSGKSLEEFRSVMSNPAIRSTLNIPKYISNEEFSAATARAIARHPGNMRQAA
jgi:hypothetical protein